MDEKLAGYLRLLARVRAIDPKAAIWMEMESGSTIHKDSRLDNCFVFSRTPQGLHYWYDILDKLNTGDDSNE